MGVVLQQNTYHVMINETKNILFLSKMTVCNDKHAVRVCPWEHRRERTYVHGAHTLVDIAKSAPPSEVRTFVYTYTHGKNMCK